jgi:hypothetical protein
VGADVVEAQRAGIVVLKPDNEPAVAAGADHIGLSPTLDSAECSRSLGDPSVVTVHRQKMTICAYLPLSVPSSRHARATH